MERIENMAVHPVFTEKPGSTTSEASEEFQNMLNEALNEVNKTQLQSQEAVQRLINGDATDLHNVMIASEKASITLTAAVEVRNKAIDAYNSIMRMQI